MKIQDYDRIRRFQVYNPQDIFLCKNDFLENAPEQFVIRLLRREAIDVLTRLDLSFPDFSWELLFRTYLFGTFNSALRYFEHISQNADPLTIADFSHMYLLKKTPSIIYDNAWFFTPVKEFAFSEHSGSFSISLVL